MTLNWVRKHSTKYNREYWLNTKTRKTTWVDPKYKYLSSIPADAINGWVKRMSVTQGKPYWFNVLTRETAWENPVKEIQKVVTPPTIGVVLKETSPDELSVEPGKKCPKGRKRDPKTKKCVRSGGAGGANKPTTPEVPRAAVVVSEGSPDELSVEPGKKCPKGRRRDPKTKKCVRSGGAGGANK